MENTCSGKENGNSETASSKTIKEINLDSATKDVHVIKYKMSKAKERCMTYFRSLHSHLQVLLKEDLKGTRIEHGFKRTFMSLFGQDADTFTSTMLLNVDQLQKQLDKEEKSMAAFWVFRDELIQHMENVKKSVAERTCHQRQYERRVNKRQMQTHEGKVDSSKAFDVSLVVTECSGTKLDKHDTSSSSGNYITHAVDVDIRPVNDQVPSAEVHLTTQHNVLANVQQHTNQSEPSYDTYLLEKVDSNTTSDSTNMCHRGGEID
ncbi:hypothetical protein Tco_0477715 [Tanacetum coccineum]